LYDVIFLHTATVTVTRLGNTITVTIRNISYTFHRRVDAIVQSRVNSTLTTGHKTLTYDSKNKENTYKYSCLPPCLFTATKHIVAHVTMK